MNHIKVIAAVSALAALPGYSAAPQSIHSGDAARAAPASAADAKKPGAVQRRAGVAGRLLRVGPGSRFSSPCKALTAARNGDVIEIDGKTVYRGDVCAFAASNLSIRGVHGRPTIDAAGRDAQGKGIWVVLGAGTVIENIEFTGARVPDRNGAAIRLEGLGLTVRWCHFHDNENGILTHNDGKSEIIIENSEFGHNGHGDGQSHNLYIGAVARLTFRYNYSHDANVGHNLKSRARVNMIVYNRFSSTTPDDSAGVAVGEPSYEIDLPDAGTSYVIGNVIEQPADNQNPVMLAYGLEKARNPGHDLYVVNNSFLNRDPSGGHFIRIGGVNAPALIQNNLFVGKGATTNQLMALRKSNYQAAEVSFVDQKNYDLRPAPDAPFVDRGSAPGVSASGVSLTPDKQYVHVANSKERKIVGPLDIGAYEATVHP